MVLSNALLSKLRTFLCFRFYCSPSVSGYTYRRPLRNIVNEHVFPVRTGEHIGKDELVHSGSIFIISNGALVVA